MTIINNIRMHSQCVHVRVRVCARVCMCVHACVRVCVRACMCVYTSIACYASHMYHFPLPLPPDTGDTGDTDGILYACAHVTLHVVTVHMYSLWRCCFFLRCPHCYHCLLGGIVGGNHDHIWNCYSCVVLKDSQTETEWYNYQIDCSMLLIVDVSTFS